MNKRIIAVITAFVMSAAVFTACTDKESTETSEAAEQTAVVETTQETAVETAEETVVETSSGNSDGIPQPGDTYNGHTVDHTEDQPDCDDSSHGTIWIFYTDSEDIDYITY